MAYDVIVIGGGPAGYVSAIKAAQLGGKVAVVEKQKVGGTCLNRGCIPTKTFLKNTEIIEGIKKAEKRGIQLVNNEYSVDINKLVAYKNKVVKNLTDGVAGLLKSHDIDLFDGTGVINKDKKVIVNDDTVLESKKIIIATGSKAAKIKIPGIESKLVVTSTEILDIDYVPKRLAIIGGGVIGVELAVAFSSFGSKVTIIEMADNIVPNMDISISKELFKHLKKKKIKILTGTKLEQIAENDNVLTLKTSQKEIEADLALLSIGRVPDLDVIKDIDIKTEKGKILVNENMETNIKGIYAPGDVNGRLMLAHAAFKMGEVAAVNAMGGNEKVKLNYVPGCVYTLPEIGSVGLTEEEAKEKYDIEIGTFPFGANGRALASGEGFGFVKVIAEKKYKEILGIHIIGPNAAEMANEAAVLMELEVPADEVAEIIHGHPTYGEALMEACADVTKSCIHLPKK